MYRRCVLLGAAAIGLAGCSSAGNRFSVEDYFRLAKERGIVREEPPESNVKAWIDPDLTLRVPEGNISSFPSLGYKVEEVRVEDYSGVKVSDRWDKLPEGLARLIRMWAEQRGEGRIADAAREAEGALGEYSDFVGRILLGGLNLGKGRSRLKFGVSSRSGRPPHDDSLGTKERGPNLQIELKLGFDF